ncbi:MAG: efflux RND transporter periplasmic adaptor subunit [Chitinispirillales bacterium]|jgi:RND family efflux transporter MFP subunit|nr:efflux RND transporter periplasmic adaptor subunit [Chitinispirillales bacterium]
MRSFKMTVIVAAAAIALTSCGKKDEAKEKSQTIQEIQAVQGIPVTVSTAKKSVVRHVEKTSGTTEGIRQSYLTNAMSGTLQKISVKTGQRVKEGDVIASMYFEDGSPRSAAQANYDYAERMYERVRKLQEEGAATLEQIEGARVNYENALKGLKGANAAEFVRAPFDGVILEIYQSEGTKIDARTQIAHMADFSRIKVDAMVNELNINKYSNGQKAFVLVGDKDTLWGRATSVAVGGIAQNHGFRVTFEFPNPNNKLKVGMFKEIFVIIEEKTDAISVPIDVVVYKAGKPGVFVINGETAVLRQVEPGINSGSNLEIISGLKEKERFVVSGATLLSDGKKVNITEQKNDE